MMRTCFYCGKPLATDPKVHQKRFCSVECRKAYGWHAFAEGKVGLRAKPFPFVEWPEERKERWMAVWQSDYGIAMLNRLLRKHIPMTVILKLRKEGCSYGVISKRLGIDPATVRQRLKRWSDKEQAA